MNLKLETDSVFNNFKYGNFQLKKADLWSVQFNPQQVQQCIGNSSEISQFANWLSEWDKEVLKGIKTPKNQITNPNVEWKWGVKDSGAGAKASEYFRACIISGPSGIGKTTTARLIGKKLGYELIETNASDLRNKNEIKNMIGTLTQNKIIKRGNLGKSESKCLIIMDELEGMTASDHGGINELISLIRETNIPIVCICNDLMNPKVRSLAGKCFSVKFKQPSKLHVAQRMQFILQKKQLEGLIDYQALVEIAQKNGCDIRYMTNLLELWSKNPKTIKAIDGSEGILLKTGSQDITGMINYFEAVIKLMCREQFQKLTLKERLALFYIDPDLIPLFVQENYLNSMVKNQEYDINCLEKMAQAAEAISDSNILSKFMNEHQEYILMNNFGFMSSIYPCQQFSMRIEVPLFPSWLGRNSNYIQQKRLLREITTCMGKKVTGSLQGFLKDYLNPLIQLVVSNLEIGESGIQVAYDLLKYYNLKFEHTQEHFAELIYRLIPSDPFSQIEPSVKNAFFKRLNETQYGQVNKKIGMNKLENY